MYVGILLIVGILLLPVVWISADGGSLVSLLADPFAQMAVIGALLVLAVLMIAPRFMR